MRKSITFRLTVFSIILCYMMSFAPAIVLSETGFIEDFSGKIEYESVYSYGHSAGDGLAADEYRDFSWQYKIDDALHLDSKKAIQLGEKFYYYPQSTVKAQGKNCFSLTEFDVYTEKSNSSPRYDVYLTSSQSSGRFFGVIRVEGNLISAAGNETADESSIAFGQAIELSAGGWHHVRILMQCTDENANAYAVLSSVSVDGINIFTSDEERKLASYKSKLKYYDMLCIQNRQNVPGGYIDNVSVQRISEYDGKTLPVDKGELLYSVRKTADFMHKYSFLKETSPYKQLEKAYEEATALLDEGGTAEEYHKTAVSLDTVYENMVSNNQNPEIKEFLYNSDDAIKGIVVKNDSEIKDAQIFLCSYEKQTLTDVIKVDSVDISEGLSEIIFKTPVPVNKNAENVQFFMWNDKLQPLRTSVDVLQENLCDNLEIKVNGNLYFTDTDAMMMADGTIYVPAENILNLMGASLTKISESSYHAERIDGTFLDFTVGSDSMLTSDGVIKGAVPYIYKECLPVISIESLCEAFGGDYYTDWETNTLNVSTNYTENIGKYRAPSKGEIEYFNSGYGSFCFKINAPASAKVEVFTRVDQMHAEEVLPVRYVENVGKAYSGWGMPNESVILWKKAYDLQYVDGKWVGSFSGIRNNSKYYDVMYRVTQNGVTETVFQRRAVLLPSCYPEMQNVVYEAKNLKLVSTFENISYYYESKQVENPAVLYKKSTESTWKKGFTPTYDDRFGQYLGSITGLSPNTTYDVKLVLGNVEATKQITTWSENPVCREIPLSEIYSGGTLVLQGLKGTDDCWIKIVGDETEVVDGGENNWESVYISDCKNLILENITVKGGKRYGISISGGSENIRISNCDISEWGRLGVWSDESHTYRLNFGSVNYDSGIFLTDAKNVVIERCYFHDCNARTNPWNGEDYNQVHPAGGSAIYTHMSSGFVVRYNDFIGNSVNRWNDAIEGAFNSSDFAGIGFDADIYGNMFFGGNDDSMELDGGSMNVRVYKNRIEQFYCGISFAPIKIGPVYVFGNLIYNLGDRETNSAYPTKQGSALETGNGKQFWFNNTFFAKKTSRILNTTAYNNIITSDMSVNAVSEQVVGDYNLVNGKKNTYSQKYILHNVAPGFKDFTTGNFTLKSDSPAKGAGTKIDNFMEKDNPDIGASAYSESFPARPVQISADKSFIKIKDQKTATVTIRTGNVEKGLSFSVQKSSADSWIEISGDTDGELQSNKEYTITVTTDMDKLPKEAKIQSDDLYGAIVFRLSNGYSVPVTIRCVR